MPSEMGKRFACDDLGAQYMVTKTGSGDLSCIAAGDTKATLLGKRYQCADCEATVLCTKAAAAVICCDGVPMTLLAAKSLPSSD
jgi:hypothetical protein